MGEKKRKEEKVKTWYKVLAILACIFVAALMVISSLGSSWISALRVIQPGDSVTVQVTVHDANGDPLLTSDQNLYENLITANRGVFFAQNMVFVANQNTSSALVAVPVYSPNNGWSDTFALFSTEYDTIGQSLVGMKTNEEKTLTLPVTEEMTQTWTAANLKSQGMNITDIHVGDQLSIAVSNSAALEKNATSSSYSVRVGEVTAKSTEGITVSFGYPTIDIKVVKIATS